MKWTFTSVNMELRTSTAILQLALSTIAILTTMNMPAQEPESITNQNRSLRSLADPIVQVPVSGTDTGLVSWFVYERMGNRFIASYLLGSADATPTRNYAALDNSDGRISFGYNMAFHKGEEQWRGLFTLGAKADVSKGFAPVYSAEKGFRESIGAQAKFTFIGNPALRFLDKHRAPVQQYVAYKDAMLDHKLESWIAQDSAARKDMSAISIEDRGKEVAKKKEELEEELIGAIIDRLEGKRLFSGIWNWWITADAYIPLTRTKVLVADSARQLEPLKTETYPLTAEVRAFLGWKSADGRSILGTLGVSVLNNNSALAQQLKTVPFLTTLGRSGADTLETTVINSEEVYVVRDYRQFLSPALEVGVVVAPSSCHPLIRFRASVQQFLNTEGNAYTPTIWTLGIPFTLLDKQKKPTVNLEPQLRLLNGVGTWGMSVGVPLGEWLD